MDKMIRRKTNNKMNKAITPTKNFQNNNKKKDPSKDSPILKNG